MKYVHIRHTHAPYLWAIIIITAQDSSLLGQAFFCTKKLTKKVVTTCHDPAGPLDKKYCHVPPLIPSPWSMGIMGISLLLLSTDQSLVINWLRYPSPRKCCTSDSRPEAAKPRISKKVLWDSGISSLQHHQPLKWRFRWLGTHLTLQLIFIQIPWNISPNYLFCLFQGHEKDRAQKSKLITERFYVHSSPLIYWKFQHLKRRKKAKSAGILAGWRVIEKRSEFPQNKHTKPRLLSSAVKLWVDWHPCHGIKGREMGARQRKPWALNHIQILISKEDQSACLCAVRAWDSSRVQTDHRAWQIYLEQG